MSEIANAALVGGFTAIAVFSLTWDEEPTLKNFIKVTVASAGFVIAIMLGG